MSEHHPSQSHGSAGEDQLEGFWYLIIWGSVLLAPFGTTMIIVTLSSVLYYVWIGSHPQKARTINLHGWLAFLTALVVWPLVICGGIFFLESLFSL